MNNRLKFSQRHPFLFTLGVVIVAMILFVGIMAFFKFKVKGFLLEKNKIGLVNIYGVITDSRQVLRWIDKLKEDPDIKGVIVRINSPGGSVAASQEIYQAIKELSFIKPVVVSMGDIAASGGYYIACGATKIIANPGTITGSIGVIAKLPNIKKLLDKLGVKDEIIASGKYKATGAITKELSKEEKAYIQSLVNDLHDQFVRAVSEGRHLPLDKVRKLANGKVYTGRQAKELGLVDMLGNFDTAIREIKRLCKIKGKVFIVEGPKRKPLLWSLLFGNRTCEDSMISIDLLRRLVCTPF